MSLLCRPLHIPAAKPSGEARVDVFKEQVLLLPLDQDSETVSVAVVVCGSSRPEVPDSFDRDLVSFGYRHVGHLRSLVLSPQEAVVDINGQLEVLTAANQTVHLKRKKRRWNAELFGNAEKVGVAGVNQIQHLLIIQ